MGAGAAGIAPRHVQRRPAGVAGYAVFVAHPAEIRPAVAEHNRSRHQLADDSPGVIPVVIVPVINLALLPGAAVKAVAAIGAVEPNGEDVAVIRQEFAQLVAVISNVFRPAIVFVVAVPGREINAELQSVPAASRGYFLDHVTMAALPRTVLHRMLGIVTRPKAEAVVVFGRQDETLHSGLLGHRDNLIGVEGGRVEDLLVLVAITPFLVGEGVHGEVQEAIEFHLVPAKLPLGGHRTERLWRWNGVAPRGGDRIQHCKQAEAHHGPNNEFHAGNNALLAGGTQCHLVATSDGRVPFKLDLSSPAKERRVKARLAACIHPTHGLLLPGRETAVHLRRGKDRQVRWTTHQDS